MNGFRKDLAWVIPIAVTGCLAMCCCVAGFGFGRPWLGALGICLFVAMVLPLYPAGPKEETEDEAACGGDQDVPEVGTSEDEG